MLRCAIRYVDCGATMMGISIRDGLFESDSPSFLFSSLLPFRCKSSPSCYQACWHTLHPSVADLSICTSDGLTQDLSRYGALVD